MPLESTNGDVPIAEEQDGLSNNRIIKAKMYSMKKILLLNLFLSCILQVLGQKYIVINDGVPYTVDPQISSTVIDMDAFDAFIEKMEEADKSGDVSLCSEV